METIKIFVASSIVELERERKELANYILNLNHAIFYPQNIHLQWYRPENMTRAVSMAGSQANYDRAIRDSKFFFLIAGRHLGKYTEAEFDVALSHFRKTRQFPKIYPWFFLPGGQMPEESTWSFWKRLRDMGHYPTTFATWEVLQSQLLIELLRQDDEPGESLPYEGIEPYIYVSYSHKDHSLVLPILDAIKSKGYRVWYDENIPLGSSWAELIPQRIRSSSVFLVFCSSNTKQSESITNEVALALNTHRVVIPVYLDEESKIDSRPIFSIGLMGYQHINYYEFDNIQTFINALEKSPSFAMCKVENGILLE